MRQSIHPTGRAISTDLDGHNHKLPEPVYSSECAGSGNSTGVWGCRPQEINTAGKEEIPVKTLEKATADYEKAKARMEASKAKYEADLKKFRSCEADKTEAENLEIVNAFRALNLPLSEIRSFTDQMKNGLSPMTENKEEEEEYDESGENETEENNTDEEWPDKEPAHR
jgi:hypothetical protein